MDDLLVGTLSPKLPSETSLPSVMSSATFSVEIIPGHRDHRSGDHDKLITITPESAITIVRKADHDRPEARSRSLGISDHDRPESPRSIDYRQCTVFWRFPAYIPPFLV
jgi:hypothetical protein